MGMMFCGCEALTSLDLSHFDTSLTTNIGYMFYDCKSLKSLDLSSFSTSLVKDMNNMFTNCILLTSLDLSNFNMDSVENIISMFSGCKNLENVNIINSNPNPTNIKTNFNNLFKGTPNNIVVCTESSIITQEFNPSECHKIYCSENWRENHPKIIANSNNNKCYNDCSETPNNKYDYYSKCYQIWPSSTYTIDFKSENCHPDCEACDGPYDDTNSHCTSCKSPDKHLLNGNCISNYINVDSTNEIDLKTSELITTDLLTELTTNIKTNIRADFTTDMKEDFNSDKIKETTTDIYLDNEIDKTTDLLNDIIFTKKTNEINTDLTKDTTTYIETDLENIKISYEDKYIDIISLYNTTNNIF